MVFRQALSWLLLLLVGLSNALITLETIRSFTATTEDCRLRIQQLETSSTITIVGDEGAQHVISQVGSRVEMEGSKKDEVEIVSLVS
jgi:hypothetical protein